MDNRTKKPGDKETAKSGRTREDVRYRYSTSG